MLLLSLKFPEMRRILDTDPIFHSSRKALSELKRLQQNPTPNSLTQISREASADRQYLLSLLPAQNVCDTLVDVYFQSFGLLYDFVHRPTFIRRYKSLWSKPHNSHPIFISLVLLVIAVAMLRDTVSRSKAKHITRTVEIFLFGIDALRKPRIALFQTLCLLILSRFIGCAETESPDSLWSIMGMTMRMAFATGSHRNPCRFGNITPFRAEMRKRLWANFLRMDLEYAVQYGMPHTLRATDHDCPFPSNLDSNDLDEDMTVSPKAKMDHTYTDSSFGVLMAKLVCIGLEIQNAVCSPENCLSLGDARTYYDRLERVLDDVPRPPSLESGSVGPMVQMQQTDIHIHPPLEAHPLHPCHIQIGWTVITDAKEHSQ